MKREISSLDQIISKGGEVAADKVATDKIDWKMINIRVRADLLLEIDQELKDRIGIKRTAWILEAIQEKLKKKTSTSS